MASITMRKDANWDKFARRVTLRRYKPVMERVMRQATGQNAHYIQKEARQRISPGRRYTHNAELTLAIKGNKTAPLVDTSRRIWQAIAVQVIAWNKAFVGVHMREGVYDLAKALHDGVSVRVTPKMRAMFFFLWLKSLGRNVVLTGRAVELWERNKKHKWYPLRDETTTLTIPPRPFMLAPMVDPEVLANVRQRWEQALQAAFKLIMEKD